MLERIIRLAIAHRWLVLVLALALAGLGVWNYARLPIDATPDITNVQVQINTEAPGYSPLEAEQRLTFPIETALAGLARLDYTRSISRYGLSQVTVVFEDGTDIYFARQQVAERLQQAKSQLPPGSEPVLGPGGHRPRRDLHVHGGIPAGRDRPGWQAVDADRPAHAAGLGGAPAIASPGGRHRGQHRRWLRSTDPCHAGSHATGRVRRGAARPDGGHRSQQRQRRGGLHRTQRRTVPGPRAGPGRRARRTSRHRRRPSRRRADPAA